MIDAQETMNVLIISMLWSVHPKACHNNLVVVWWVLQKYKPATTIMIFGFDLEQGLVKVLPNFVKLLKSFCKGIPFFVCVNHSLVL